MALRLQIVSQNNHESRPSPWDTKKFGILGRLATIGRSLRSRHNQNPDKMNSNQKQNRIRTDSNNSAASMTTCSSSCTSQFLTSATLSSTGESVSGSVPKNESAIPICHNNCCLSLQSSSKGPLNAMKWMQNDCPKDVVPLILAFAGPQRIDAIGNTNRFWRDLIEQESTWRRLCEMLYKVRSIKPQKIFILFKKQLILIEFLSIFFPKSVERGR